MNGQWPMLYHSDQGKLMLEIDSNKIAGVSFWTEVAMIE